MLTYDLSDHKLADLTCVKTDSIGYTFVKGKVLVKLTSEVPFAALLKTKEKSN